MGVVTGLRAYRIPEWVVRRQGWRSILGDRARGSVDVVTVDWDDVPPDGRCVRRRFRYLDIETLAWDWRRSPGGNVHLRRTDVWCNAFWTRGVMEDDPMRLKFDAYRFRVTGDAKYAEGFLWDEKTGRDGVVRRAGRWHKLG